MFYEPQQKSHLRTKFSINYPTSNHIFTTDFNKINGLVTLKAIEQIDQVVSIDIGFRCTGTTFHPISKPGSRSRHGSHSHCQRFRGLSLSSVHSQQAPSKPSSPRDTTDSAPNSPNSMPMIVITTPPESAVAENESSSGQGKGRSRRNSSTRYQKERHIFYDTEPIECFTSMAHNGTYAHHLPKGTKFKVPLNFEIPSCLSLPSSISTISMNQDSRKVNIEISYQIYVILNFVDNFSFQDSKFEYRFPVMYQAESNFYFCDAQFPSDEYESQLETPPASPPTEPGLLSSTRLLSFKGQEHVLLGNCARQTYTVFNPAPNISSELLLHYKTTNSNPNLFDNQKLSITKLFQQKLKNLDNLITPTPTKPTKPTKVNLTLTLKNQDSINLASTTISSIPINLMLQLQAPEQSALLKHDSIYISSISLSILQDQVVKCHGLSSTHSVYIPLVNYHEDEYSDSNDFGGHLGLNLDRFELIKTHNVESGDNVSPVLYGLETTLGE
ncbi:unnamed protein product [Ambrosiozyma monospora]|uniref:Unnamed protein product n=1 Tax=Ambrosiozyma monospora TaxID=43982 RepID=A0ACB5T124_AMBMO|nr:unnamed protein product [Ambrosiozyma monospora]